MIDGDDTYPLDCARELVDKVLMHQADMVVGDRLSSTYFEENKRPFHNFGNSIVRWSINTLFKNDIKDTKDNKSVLQEFLQRSIEYRLESESGPAHNKTFVCSAVVDNIVYGVGEGKTKKAAEQEAAKEALDILAKKQ